MNSKTASQVVEFARRCGFQIADITGGAPEMNPNLGGLIVSLAAAVPQVILRSNLTAVHSQGGRSLLELCRENRVTIIGSLPSVNTKQTDSQRGGGVWEKIIATLRELNSMGYGQTDTGLELHLVCNPAGAYLPPSQSDMEKRFRQDLYRKLGIVFNNLYTFANSPLGRYRRWLQESGNYENYMGKLVSSFNPCTVQGLMCRTLVSVSWDGYLHDCDFNIASGLFMGGCRVHVSEMEGLPPPGSPIAVADHCYACTAGSGFT